MVVVSILVVTLLRSSTFSAQIYHFEQHCYSLDVYWLMTFPLYLRLAIIFKITSPCLIIYQQYLYTLRISLPV